jgi:hypothetical protein
VLCSHEIVLIFQGYPRLRATLKPGISLHNSLIPGKFLAETSLAQTASTATDLSRRFASGGSNPSLSATDQLVGVIQSRLGW